MVERIALIVGATGLVGRECLPLLLKRYERVVALGRRAALAPHERLVEQVVDFERLGEHAELLRGDDLFCCLGTTIKAAGSQEAFRRVDHDYVVELAKLANAQAVRRFFLVSALGADAGSKVFYNRVKGETEEAVGNMGFVAVHIVRPSLLLGDRDESRPAERLGQFFGRLAGPLFVGPLATYRAIPAADVAAALVACADSDATGVRVHHPRPR